MMVAQPTGNILNAQSGTNQLDTSRTGLNILRWLLSAILMSVAIILVIVMFGAEISSRLLELLLVVALATYFPFTYLAYRTVRTEIRRKRLEDELELLGYPKDETTWLFEQIHDQSSYWLFIMLAILTTVVGTALLFGEPPSLAIASNTAQAIRYGFLGSYLFSTFLVYRRFSTNDLHPTVYLYCAFTIIAGLVFNYVGFEAITKIAGDDTAATGVGAGLLAIIAFSLGYFPYLAVRWFNRLAFTSLGVSQRRTDLMPLGLIDGISEWHETRLRDTGIDDIQNLAAVEIRELLVNTAFSVQEVIEWIDQAVLYLYLEPSEIEAFRRAKIRMTSDFCVVWQGCENDNTKRDEVVLNLQSTEERLKILYSSIIEGPNVHRVLNYWKRAKSRVELNTEWLWNQLPKLDYVTERMDTTDENSPTHYGLLSELAKEYCGLLNKLWYNPSNDDIVNLGTLYRRLGDYDKAIVQFDTVIDKVKNQAVADDLFFAAYAGRIYAHTYHGNQEAALSDCGTLLEKTRTAPKMMQIEAQFVKGNVLAYFKNYDAAVLAYEEAIKIDPQYAGSYNTLAWHYVTKQAIKEKLPLALENASKSVQFSEGQAIYPNCLDTLAYAQILCADNVETTEDAKAKLYISALQNLKNALKRPESIPEFGYAAITERLWQIINYWQSVDKKKVTASAVEQEENSLLTLLPLPTQTATSREIIMTRLKELHTLIPSDSSVANGVKPQETPMNINLSR